MFFQSLKKIDTETTFTLETNFDHVGEKKNKEKVSTEDHNDIDAKTILATNETALNTTQNRISILAVQEDRRYHTC